MSGANIERVKKMKYKCIKDFSLDEYDDNGAFADKQILCEKDSIWETDEIANRFIGDKDTVRLIEISNKDSFRWMEVSKEMLDECFECEVDSGKLKGEIKLGQHATNKDDYWIYDDNGLICGTAGINEDKVKALINIANKEIPME